MKSLNLCAAVAQAYAQAEGPVSQEELYDAVARTTGVSSDAFNERRPVGQAQAQVSLLKRRVRWYQQTLKHAGVIEPAGERGVWKLTGKGLDGSGLPLVADGTAILGFSTELGIAVISSCEHFFSKVSEPIHLIVTSPPYPLAQPRAYGNVSEVRYVDWLCKVLEPVVRNLVQGGSICLNVGNDIFMPNSPARSLYRERLVLALHARLGLYKMDEIIWTSPKPPGPVAWASKKRVQLNTGYEPVYWLTNDPDRVLADNRRVLQPHTEEHLRFVRSGGVKRESVHSDGAYRKRIGAYGGETSGRIPKNVLEFARCAEDRDQAYRRYCAEYGLAPHGASMPVRLAKFLIEYLTEKGQLVVDGLAGRCKVGLAAEELGRRWICVDRQAQSVIGARAQFV
ncbi:site-specific DNA-methyltransferase [Achromobacter insolitus]|uniref:site-specific DNA-methyltransferase n=2 Tax=Pseudomonadota TaxID=1224 RepID=UPI000AC4C7B2|nr:site-specific DNA-methyltransferase [Achromobacter insolitus]